MAPKHVPPAIDLKAFSCPHCGALADQTWYTALASRTKDGTSPHLWTSGRLAELSAQPKFKDDDTFKEMLPYFGVRAQLADVNAILFDL